MRSYLTFTKQQRKGIVLLLLLIISLMCVYWFVDFSDEDLLDLDSEEIVAVQRELDSLRSIEIEKRTPRLYPFNPNYLTDYRGSVIGMSNEEIDRLLQFREAGNWINSADDFQKVTQVSDSLLSVISPYFKFPEWVAKPLPKKKPKDASGFTEKPHSEKIDLNQATAVQLQQVSGIGEVLSNRVIQYRERVNGFASESELYAIYGIDSAVVRRTLNLFALKTPREIVKININTASASDLATIPGVSFDLAKQIWEYRRLREKVVSADELSKIDGITPRKLQLIQLYLSFE